MNIIRIFLLVSIFFSGTYALFEFNNIECTTRDAAYITFEYCFLRSVNRSYKYLSMKTRVYQFPIDNVMIATKLMNRDSRTLYNRINLTVDGCRFLRKRSNPLASFMFSLMEDYTNMNHTCPYNHDVYIEKLPVQHINNMISQIVPNGRYYLNSTYLTDNTPRANVLVYFTKS